MTDLANYGSCVLADDGCTTCGDVAVPVRVLAIGANGTASCEDRAGERAEIMIEFTPDAAPGDILIVHMGVAIGKVDASGATDDPTDFSSPSAEDVVLAAGSGDDPPDSASDQSEPTPR